MRIKRGQKYIISFQTTVASKVLFNVGLRYGTATECTVNDDTRYFSYENKIEESAGKREGVIIHSTSDSSRYYVIFTASKNYDYMQVLFINDVDDCDVSTSTTESTLTYVTGSWPYGANKIRISVLIP